MNHYCRKIIIADQNYFHRNMSNVYLLKKKREQNYVSLRGKYVLLTWREFDMLHFKMSKPHNLLKSWSSPESNTLLVDGS